MTVEFELDGSRFIGLNGGPHFKFTEAVSFSIACADQAEVDYFWGKLTEGGRESQCGWLKDKYGLSWQVVPARMSELMNAPDPVKSKRVMEAMLKMKKIDIPTLEQARTRRSQIGSAGSQATSMMAVVRRECCDRCPCPGRGPQPCFPRARIGPHVRGG